MSSRTSRVQAQTALQFNPQFEALAQLIAEAKATRKSSIHNAASAAQAIQTSVDAAREPTRTIYHDAGLARQQDNQDANAVIAGLTGIDPFRAAIAREQGAAKTRIESDQANALNSLVQRGTEAASGAAFARTQADRQYASDSSKLGQQLQSLSSQAGLYSNTLYDTLTDQAKKEKRQRSIDDLNARRTIASITGIDPQTGQPTEKAANDQANQDAKTANAKEKRRKEKEAARNRGVPSLASRRGYKDKFDTSVNMAFRLRTAPNPASQDEIEQILQGKGIPPLLARAAAQTVIGGGAGANTKAKVHQRYGISVPGFTAARNKKARNRINQARGHIGVGTSLGGYASQ